MDTIPISGNLSIHFIPTTTISQTPLSNPTHSDPFVSGWRSPPQVRGTIHIIWSCVSVIFLCTWTVLCLNVPARNEPKMNIFLRRLRWMLLAIAGPEFVLGFAAGQYENAYNAVATFRKLGHTWTMRHAFFADMGGFHLHPRDSTPFPVNNKHIHWLIENKFMEFPVIDQQDIWDMSKADSLIKWLTCLQIGWLLLNVAARAFKHLAITTIELGTVSIMVCSIGILIIWLQKPSDVMTTIPLHIEASTSEILCAAGDIARNPYVMTPLDFVDNMGPSWTANVLAFINIRAGPRDRPLPRFTNDRFPHVRGIRYAALVIMTLFGVGIHLFGWHYRFPTRGEQIAWRVASLQMVWTAAIFWTAEIVAGWKRDSVAELWYCMIFTRSQLPALQERRRLRPPRAQPIPENFPLRWECGASFSMGLLYMIARVYIIVEMFAGLRRLPESTFSSVDWTDFIPHM